MSIAIFISLSLVVVSKNELPKTEEKIPLLEVTGGERGKLGINKNINETNIGEYLNRPDANTVEEYIEAIIYNHNYIRLSYALNYKTPIEYRTQLGFK